MSNWTDLCEHGFLVDEHFRVCDEHDECQPPPSFGYRDRAVRRHGGSRSDWL